MPNRDERGATATEYGILVFFLVFALVAGVTLFGQGLGQAFQNLATWIETLASTV